MKHIAIILVIMTVVSACKLMPKERWEVSALDQPPPKKQLIKKIKYKSTDKDNTSLYLTHPFIAFVNSYNEANVCSNNTKDKGDECHDSIIKFVDNGINLSNRFCNEWFSRHLRDDAQIKQTQGLVNVVGDSALALGGLFDASSNATGVFSIFLGGYNNGMENYKKYNLLVEDAIDSLEDGVRKGRIESAKNLRKNISNKNITFPQAQVFLRDYHNTCNRIQLVHYIKNSVELSVYEPKLKDTKKETQLSKLSKKAFFSVFQKDGNFMQSDVEKLFYATFGSPDIKDEIVKTSNFIKNIMNIVDGFSGDASKESREIEFRVSIHNSGLLLGLETKLKEKIELVKIDKKVYKAKQKIKAKKKGKKVIVFDQAINKIYQSFVDRGVGGVDKKSVKYACKNAIPDGTHTLFSDEVDGVVNLLKKQNVNNVAGIAPIIQSNMKKTNELSQLEKHLQKVQLKEQQLESNFTEDNIYPISLEVFSKGN